MLCLAENLVKGLREFSDALYPRRRYQLTKYTASYVCPEVYIPTYVGYRNRLKWSRLLKMYDLKMESYEGREGGTKRWNLWIIVDGILEINEDGILEINEDGILKEGNGEVT